MNSKSLKHLFPILVLVLSLITIVYYRNYERNYISFAVSLVGILGVVLFYLKSKLLHVCFNSWIIAQFLIVYVTSDVAIFDFDIHPLFVAIQTIFFKYTFTIFTFQLDPGQILHIEFNFIPILLYFLYLNALGHDLGDDSDHET